MADLTSQINLQDILKITDIEFKNYFKDWLQNDEIANQLQARLRKDLVVHFNKTTLGRKIFSKHIYSQRMIFSPLILVLNTLVSEFLYAQNCHYSLSVLCTEVPYRNTLPDFENIKNFRFKENEILEIFEAINVQTVPIETQHEICSEYLANLKGPIPLSLLYVIFKNLFKPIKVEQKIIIGDDQGQSKQSIKNTVEEKENSTVKNVGMMQNNENLDWETTDENNINNSVIEKKLILNNNESNSKHSKKKHLNATTFNNNFRYLNKYLITLSKKVKDMSTNFEKLDKEKLQTRKKSLNDRNFNYINRSLEKITDNLKFLALSKQKNRRFTKITQGIEQMTRQFENCAKNFESIYSKSKSSNEKSYADWLKELQTTKNGQKFISKVEISLRKTIDREKEKIIEMYGIKFTKEKEILKLKYKQKIIMLMNTIQQLQEESELNRNLYIENETKLKEISIEPIESVQKSTQTEENLFQGTIDNQIIKPINSGATPLIKLDYTADEISPSILNLAKQIAQKDKSILQENTKPIHRIPTKSVELEKAKNEEKYVDHIAYDAKLRIQELEKESAEIDKTFKEHLRKQEAFKAESAANIQSIWKNYQRDKNLINTKCTALRDQSAYKRKNYMLSKQLDFEKILREVPQIGVENIVKKYTQNKATTNIVNSEQSNFENPFRELKNIFLKNTPLQLAATIDNTRQNSYNIPFIEKSNSSYNKNIVVPDIRLDEYKDNTNDVEDLKLSPLGAQSSNLLGQFDLKNVSLEDIEVSSIKSSSTSSLPPAASYLRVFKSKRELFPKEIQTTKDITQIKKFPKDQQEIQQNVENKKKLYKKTKTIKKPSSVSVKDIDILATGDGMNVEALTSTQDSSHDLKTLYTTNKIINNTDDSKVNSEDTNYSSRNEDLGNNLIFEKEERIENNKININIQELTKSKNDENESTGTNESGLSVFIINSQTKTSIRSTKSNQSPKLNQNIFQLNTFRKDEDVDKILNSSESGTSIKSNRRAKDEEEFVKNKNSSEDNLDIPSPFHDISSSLNSNLSLSMSIGGDVKDDKSFDDFWR